MGNVVVKGSAMEFVCAGDAHVFALMFGAANVGKLIVKIATRVMKNRGVVDRFTVILDKSPASSF